MRTILTLTLLLSSLYFGNEALSFSGDENNTIHFDTVDIAQQDFTCDYTCTTHVFQAFSPFRYAAVQAPLDTQFEVRFFDNERWLDWTRITSEDDRPDGVRVDTGSAFFVMHHARAFQMRSDRAMQKVTVVTYSLPTSTKSGQSQKVHIAVSDTLPTLPLISRADWLDPSIELQSARRDQLWKSEYDTIKKIVVHHTATTVRDVNGDGIVNDADYREAVRGIYSYHTYSQKWGDIGYNYIIDPLGKIWEGRYGGDGVIAGHTYRSKQCTKFSSSNISLNDGSVGIALLGTFSSDTPSFQARDSLVSLISQTAWSFGIDPSGSGFFIDGVYPNVVAHRDLDCTECPGNAFYADMPSIVRDSTTAYAALNSDVPHRYAAEKITVSPSRIEMKKGDVVEVHAMYWNTGTTTWRGYGDAPLVLASSDIKQHLASLEALHLASVEDGGSSNNTQNKQSFIRAKLTEANVAPRRAGTFSFNLADPPDELISHQSFTLALGQQGWIPLSDASVEVINTGLEWAALRTEGDPTPTVTDEPGRKITIHFINKGTKIWKRGEVLLAVQGVNGAASNLKDRSWKKKDGRFAFEEKEVGVGDQATFSFLATASHIGIFQESTALVVGDKTISGSGYVPLIVEVKPAYEAEIIGMNYAPAGFVKGTIQATLAVKNVGTREWKKAALSARATDGKSASPFRSKKWKDATTVQTLKTVKPGQVLILTVPLAMPSDRGLYRHTLSFANGTQKIYLKSNEAYMDSIDQEIRVDPLPAKKTVKK